MTTRVIDVKPDHDGHTRVTLAEPYGATQAQRKVVARCPGRTRDHAGVLVNARGDTVHYEAGDPAESHEIWLSGQREFCVHPDTTRLEFDDGAGHELDSPQLPLAQSPGDTL